MEVASEIVATITEPSLMVGPEVGVQVVCVCVRVCVCACACVCVCVHLYLGVIHCTHLCTCFVGGLLDSKESN